MAKKTLFVIFIILSLLSVGCDGDDPSEARSPGVASYWEIEQAVFNQINQYRQSIGLTALAWNETIAESCRAHSLDMAAGRVAFGHSGFNDRLDQIGQFIPFTNAAENVAQNNYPDPATTAVDGWLNSQGHLDNIEGYFNLTGVGVARSDAGDYFITQIFILE